nr:phage holin family protein [uncultured Alloprevotella sp.]
MLSSDQNIQTIRELVLNLKEYAELKAESVQIGIIRKLSILITALIVGGLAFVLAAIIIFFLSGTLALALAPHVGGTAISCLIVATFYLLLGCLIYAKRTAWILNPIANFIGELFLKSDESIKEKLDGTE